ncbi:MAG: PorT family protein [Bacteroidetes bacterium]|nr:PorT family protein [Bacteroidota bacterium]MCH8170472.1 PorT family protein [Bacteroidota bacterium]
MLTKYSPKIISLLFILVFASTISIAQIKIGLNGGANFSTFTTLGLTANVTFKRKFGFSIGAIAEYPLLKNLSIRLNIGYEQRGAQYTIENDNILYLDYIELTPYLTYSFINSEIIAKIIGGLSFGHLLNAKINILGNDVNLKNSFNISNITTNFGLEIEKTILTKTSLIITGIYSVGLKDISKRGVGQKTIDFNLKIGFLYSL